MVPYEVFQDGRDLGHVEQVAVAPPPVQGVPAHPPRPAPCRVLLDFREDLVELVDVRQCQRVGDGEDPAGVEQIPAPRRPQTQPHSLDQLRTTCIHVAR